MVLPACKEPRPAGQAAPTGVVEALPAVSATADVDRRATLALKQDLVTRFPQNSDGGLVEAGLVEDGFTCNPYPEAPSERACLKAVRVANCEINTIVRTKPYAPEKAQVIKICELQPTPKDDPPQR
jgi:hypothetical protein